MFVVLVSRNSLDDENSSSAFVASNVKTISISLPRTAMATSDIPYNGSEKSNSPAITDSMISVIDITTDAYEVNATLKVFAEDILQQHQVGINLQFKKVIEKTVEETYYSKSFHVTF